MGKFNLENMQYVHLCQGDRKRYILEDEARSMATVDILDLNKFIKQMAEKADIRLPAIRSSSIVWYVPENLCSSFTWVKKSTLTPKGKIPKFDQVLIFHAKTFGEIHYQGEVIGKVKIVVWPDARTCVFGRCKIIDGRLTLWRVEKGYTDTEYGGIWTL